MGRSHCLALLGLLSVLFLSAASPSRAEAQGTFSSAERHRLSRGELIVRQETQQRGQLRLIGGTSWQVIEAPPSAVWRAVMDLGAWDRFVPECEEARLVSEQANRRIVRLSHQQGPVEARYHLRFDFRDQQRMAQFRVDKSRHHDIRDGWGFFIVQPFEGGRTMVTFGIMADVGTGLVSGLVRPRVHDWMMRVPSELKKWIEGSGRDRYVR